MADFYFRLSFLGCRAPGLLALAFSMASSAFECEALFEQGGVSKDVLKAAESVRGAHGGGFVDACNGRIGGLA